MICSTLPRSDTMMVRLSVRELLIWAVFVLVSTTAVQAPNPVALTSAAIDEFLAREYGHLPVDQRRNVGLVPMNLDKLIRGADHKGRLTLAAPAPGHVLLLTEPVYGEWVRGVGVMSDTDSMHFFRTSPFVLRREGADHVYSTSTSVDGLNHIPARSTDPHLFGARKLSILLPNGVYRSKQQFALSHISVLPVTGPAPGEITVYPDFIWQKLLKGPHDVEYGHGPLVEWSNKPRWNKKVTFVPNDGSATRKIFTSPAKWFSSAKPKADAHTTGSSTSHDDPLDSRAA